MHDLHVYTCNLITPGYESMVHEKIETFIIVLILVPNLLDSTSLKFRQNFVKWYKLSFLEPNAYVVLRVFFFIKSALDHLAPV